MLNKRKKNNNIINGLFFADNKKKFEWQEMENLIEDKNNLRDLKTTAFKLQKMWQYHLGNHKDLQQYYELICRLEGNLEQAILYKRQLSKSFNENEFSNLNNKEKEELELAVAANEACIKSGTETLNCCQPDYEHKICRQKKFYEFLIEKTDNNLLQFFEPKLRKQIKEFMASTEKKADNFARCTIL
jgi:hypothetical protein